MEVTKKIDEEYVVCVDLESYSMLIERDLKYRMLVDAISEALEYDEYAYSNEHHLKVNNNLLTSFKTIEPMTYSSVVQREELKHKKLLEEAEAKNKATEE